MNVQEEILDDAVDVDHPERLSAALRKRQRVEVENDSDDGEAFDFQDADDMSSSESDESVKETAPVSSEIYSNSERLPKVL